MDTKKLVSVRKEAEKAVVGMPDGDLKVKAFEVILGHLLTDGTPQRKQHATQKEKDDPEPRPAKRRAIPKSTSTRILLLRDDGFFKSQRSMGDISAELARHGWHYAKTALSGPLQILAQQRELRRVKSKKDKKTVWLYSEP